MADPIAALGFLYSVVVLCNCRLSLTLRGSLKSLYISIHLRSICQLQLPIHHLSMGTLDRPIHTMTQEMVAVEHNIASIDDFSLKGVLACNVSQDTGFVVPQGSLQIL